MLRNIVHAHGVPHRVNVVRCRNSRQPGHSFPGLLWRGHGGAGIVVGVFKSQQVAIGVDAAFIKIANAR